MRQDKEGAFPVSPDVPRSRGKGLTAAPPPGFWEDATPSHQMLLSPRSAFAPHRLPAVADKSCMGLTPQLMLGELPRSIPGTARQRLARIQTPAAWGRTNRSLCPSTNTWWQDRCPVPSHFRGFHPPPGSSKAQLGSLAASGGFERRRSEMWSHQTQDKDRKCPVPPPVWETQIFPERKNTPHSAFFVVVFFLEETKCSKESRHFLHEFSYPEPELSATGFDGRSSGSTLGACPVLTSSPRGSSVT